MKTKTETYQGKDGSVIEVEVLNPQQKSSFSGIFLAMSIIFVVCLIASNLFAIKAFAIGPFILPGAVIVFPISYIFNDCFVEVWGYRKTRFVIWMGFLMNFFVVLFGQIVVWLPDAPFWTGGEHFNYIFNTTPRVFIASLLAFFIGSSINAYVMSKMKVMNSGKYFSLRAVLSSLAGEAADSLIFMPIVFWGAPFWTLLGMMAAQVTVKVLYEIVILPVTIKVVKKLKEIESTDTYDHNISYNPFKLLDF